MFGKSEVEDSSEAPYSVTVSDTGDNNWEFDCKAPPDLPLGPTDYGCLKVVNSDGETTYFNWARVVAVEVVKN